MVGIADIGPPRVGADLAHALADLAGLGFDAEPVGRADRLLLLHVEADQAHVEVPAQVARRPADGPDPAVEVEHRHIALGRAVELEDLGDAETGLELAPDLRPQAIAEGHADLAVPVLRPRRLVDEVAAELADVDEHGRLRGQDLVPEMAGRETPGQDEHPAVQQRRAHGAEAAGGVIERQGAEHPVLGPGPGRGRKAAHVELNAHVGDARGLGQAGGARGEDVERRVLGGHGAAGLAVGPDGAGALERGGQIALVAVRRAQGPDGDRLAERAAHRLQRRGRLVVDDDVRGVGQPQAVGEGPAGQVVVDQGRGHADLAEPVPGGDVVEAIRQEDADRAGAPEAPRGRPMGVAVGQRVELPIGDRPPLELQGRTLAPAIDRLLEVIAGEMG